MTDPAANWERLLAAERHLQHLVPGTVLVGGTAAAMHAGHRYSQDGDHVLLDLREHFNEVVELLEVAAGWQTHRLVRPVLSLSELEGIPTGIRQMRRVAPLETEVVAGLVVPTLPETARIKAWLLATRHTTRDYLDCVVLLERLDSAAYAALSPIDALYPQASGASVLAEVVDRLARAAPGDRAEVELASFRGLQAPWTHWSYLAARGREWAQRLAGLVIGGPPTENP